MMRMFRNGARVWLLFTLIILVPYVYKALTNADRAANVVAGSFFVAGMFAIPLLVGVLVYCLSLHLITPRLAPAWRRLVALFLGPSIPLVMASIDHIAASNLATHYWAAAVASFVCGAIVRVNGPEPRRV